MASFIPQPIKPANVNKVYDEKFGEFYPFDEKAVQLLNDGRIATSLKQGLSVCVLGVHSYSSGIHRIRIRIDSGKPCILIRSRNIAPTPNMDRRGQYNYSPSTYGWGSIESRYINGLRHLMMEKQIIKTNDSYTITLNCDEHCLSIINENTNVQDKLEIDVKCAPLPWCLFICFPASLAQVSLI